MIRPNRGRVQEERERAYFKRERGGHKLREKRKPFPFPSRCNLSFYVFSSYPKSSRIRIFSNPSFTTTRIPLVTASEPGRAQLENRMSSAFEL
ncbi:unnamed protein product [Brassica rapa subsp. narinosa]